MKGKTERHLRTAAAILIAVLLGHAFAASSVGHGNDLLAGSPLRNSSGPSTVAPRAADPLTRQGLVLPSGPGFDSFQAGNPSVLLDGNLYKMWYFGCNASSSCEIGYATSENGRNWTKQGIVLFPTLPAEAQFVAYPEVRKIGSTYQMWYDGFDGATHRILEASSPDGRNWTKHGVVLDAGPAGSPDSRGATVPRVVFDGTYRMWYTTASVSPPSILLATSADGLTWTRKGVVLAAAPPGGLDSSGVQTGAVLRVGGSYGMVYDGISNASTERLFYAVSTDGANWVRLGLALDVLPPSEILLSQPSVVALSNGSWAVYYVARAGVSDLQIYLAEGPSPLPTAGSPGGNPFILIAIVLLIGGAAVATVLFVFLLRSPRRIARPWVIP